MTWTLQQYRDHCRRMADGELTWTYAGPERRRVPLRCTDPAEQQRWRALAEEADAFLSRAPDEPPTSEPTADDVALF